MFDMLGMTVGILVGENDGTIPITTVGALVGPDFPMVGAPVGSETRVGSRVGRRLGRVVGSAEGPGVEGPGVVGIAVGAAEGHRHGSHFERLRL